MSKIKDIYNDVREIVMSSSSNFLEEEVNSINLDGHIRRLTMDTVKGFTHSIYTYPNTNTDHNNPESFDMVNLSDNYELYVDSTARDRTIKNLDDTAKVKITEYLIADQEEISKRRNSTDEKY